MINFYQAWKDDKESTPKKKKAKPAHCCQICGKRVNGLRHHVEQVHGQGMWLKYIKAEELAKRRQFLEALNEV